MLRQRDNLAARVHMAIDESGAAFGAAAATNDAVTQIGPNVPPPSWRDVTAFVRPYGSAALTSASWHRRANACSRSSARPATRTLSVAGGSSNPYGSRTQPAVPSATTADANNLPRQETPTPRPPTSPGDDRSIAPAGSAGAKPCTPEKRATSLTRARAEPWRGDASRRCASLGLCRENTTRGPLAATKSPPALAGEGRAAPQPRHIVRPPCTSPRDSPVTRRQQI